MRCRGAAALILTFAVAVCAAGPAAAQPRAPELRVETLEGTPAGESLGRVDGDHLRTIVRLVGLEDPGHPIRVVLVPEDSPLARGTPSWIAGVAHGPSDTVLLFPSRSPSYPHDSLAAVLHHEIAHILIHRAAGGRHVPRWFNEGLATIAERAWTFEDRRHLAWALATSRPVRLEDLDRAFGEGQGPAARAYALGSAFVRQIIDRHGIDAPAGILRRMALGAPFESAFESTTGMTLPAAERAFSVEVTSWERWIPLVTSPFVLWTATTLLAVWAAFAFRLRRADRRKRWDEEEAGDEDDEGVVPGDELLPPRD